MTMISNIQVDDWLKSHCRLTNNGLVWPNGTLHSWQTSREIVHVYLALGLEPSTGLLTIDLVRALLQRIEGLEMMFERIGPAAHMHPGETRVVPSGAPSGHTGQGSWVQVQPRQAGKAEEPDLTSVMSVLGVKTGDVIREGDPRMNLVQDLIEGDARRQDWARQMLSDLQAIEPHDRAGYIERHPYTEGD
jgi:hypothetical protein